MPTTLPDRPGLGPRARQDQVDAVLAEISALANSLRHVPTEAMLAGAEHVPLDAGMLKVIAAAAGAAINPPDMTSGEVVDVLLIERILEDAGRIRYDLTGRQHHQDVF